MLRALLAADGRRDAGARVVEGARTLLGAEWVVLLEQDEGRWICQHSSGEAPGPGTWWHPAARYEQAHGQGVIMCSGSARAALVEALDLSDREVLLVIGPPHRGGSHSDEGRALLTGVLAALTIALRKGEELETLRSYAYVDPLTKCYNRRGFEEHLQVELQRAQRYDRSIALMLVDLDDFKSVNDRLGHPAGDHLLRRFASLLSTTFRTSDVVSRYGGDEFAVIFPETSSSEAERLAERLRALLRDTIPDGIITREVTASCGVASYPQDAGGADSLVAASDRALYAAKRGGRDRVVIASSLEQT